MDERLDAQRQQLFQLLAEKGESCLEAEKKEADKEPIPRPTKNHGIGSRMKNLTGHWERLRRYTSGFI